MFYYISFESFRLICCLCVCVCDFFHSFVCFVCESRIIKPHREKPQNIHLRCSRQSTGLYYIFVLDLLCVVSYDAEKQNRSQHFCLCMQCLYGINLNVRANRIFLIRVIFMRIVALAINLNSNSNTMESQSLRNSMYWQHCSPFFFIIIRISFQIVCKWQTNKTLND